MFRQKDFTFQSTRRKSREINQILPLSKKERPSQQTHDQDKLSLNILSDGLL